VEEGYVPWVRYPYGPINQEPCSILRPPFTVAAEQRCSDNPNFLFIQNGGGLYLLLQLHRQYDESKQPKMDPTLMHLKTCEILSPSQAGCFLRKATMGS